MGHKCKLAYQLMATLALAHRHNSEYAFIWELSLENLILKKGLDNSSTAAWTRVPPNDLDFLEQLLQFKQ